MNGYFPKYGNDITGFDPSPHLCSSDHLSDPIFSYWSARAIWTLSRSLQSHSQCESLSLKTLRKKCKDTMEIQLGCFSNEWLSKENIVVGSTKPTGHRSFHLLMVPYLGWGSPFCTLVRNENAECGSQKMPLGGNLMVGRLVGCPPYGYIYIYISEYIRIIWLFSNMFVYVRQNPGTPGTLKHLLNERLSQKIC